MARKTTAHWNSESSLSVAPTPARSIGGGDPLRDKRIVANLPLVRWIARDIQSTLHPSVPLDELCADGAEGLIDAVDRFDPTRRVAFETFARYRVAGAIRDGLRRRRDWFGRRARNQVTLLHLDIPDMCAERAGGGPAELGAIIDARWNGRPMRQLAVDPVDGREALAEAFCLLSGAQRQLIRLCYYEHKSLSETAREMGIGRSWASRLHARALGTLREAIASSRATNETSVVSDRQETVAGTSGTPRVRLLTDGPRPR